MSDLPVEQHAHWDAVYERKPEMFGRSASASAVHAAKRFREGGATRVVELGAGHGRDTVYFAAEGFRVTALDYSTTGLAALRATAAQVGVDDLIESGEHDVRAPLPFPDNSVDAVYAHLLLCMALSTAEITRLADEVGRVLIAGGLFVYTVRNTSDAHYGVGIDHGDNIHETQGYAVHFFDRALVDTLASGWNLEEVTPDEEGRQLQRLTSCARQRPTHQVPRCTPVRTVTLCGFGKVKARVAEGVEVSVEQFVEFDVRQPAPLVT